MTGEIAIRFEEPSGLPRESWPVTRGFPLPQGAVQTCDELRLTDGAGREVPLQARSLGAPWPDGSLRWVLLHFQASAGPQSRAEYRLIYGAGVRRSPVAAGIAVRPIAAGLEVDTGPLVAHISAGDGFGAIEQAWLRGRPMLAEGEQRGFVLEDAAGTAYSTASGRVRLLAVEEEGPLRAVIHVAGDHRSANGDRLFGYEARIYACAGQPWLEIEYTFVNDADAEFTELRGIGWEVVPAAGDGRRGLCGAYRDLYESSLPFTLYADRDCTVGAFPGPCIYDAAGKHVEYPYPGEMSHRVAQGWVDVSDDEGGVLVGVSRPVETYPKELAYTGSTARVNLWPARAGVLRWRQGMARTQRLLLWFHEGSGRQAEVNKAAVLWEQPLHLWAPGWYTASGAFGPVLDYAPSKYPFIEMALRDQYTLWRSTNRALGFLDYGDHPQRAIGPRANYWANNEADLGHCFAMQYARTGEEWYFEDLEAISWHLMDVDIVHHTTHDRLELGGARIHGDEHVQYNCEGYEDISVASSHMWTEGLLEYYFLTGHPRALEIARGIGECLLNMLDAGWGMPPYKVIWHSVRDSGWPLIALTALYEATGEQRWLAGCRRIVEALLESQVEAEDWGLWLGWHRSLAPMHLGIVGTGLSRYHRITGDERVAASLIRAADAMLEKCRHPDGALVYVDNPGWRWNYYSGVTYESLGYVGELTGDTRYLQAGWAAHRRDLSSRGMAVLTGTALADWWRGNLRYMYWADKAGLLTDLVL